MADFSLFFTRHARNKMRHREMRRRGVDERVIAEVVASGERDLDKVSGRQRASKIVADWEISVVFVEEGDRVVVITVWADEP